MDTKRIACEVPNCPAIPVGAMRCCVLHRSARTAKDIGIASDPLTKRGGLSCLKCRRRFQEQDFCWRQPKETKKHRVHAAGYEHVACEPKQMRPSRRLKRDEPKPLLDLA